MKNQKKSVSCLGLLICFAFISPSCTKDKKDNPEKPQISSGIVSALSSNSLQNSGEVISEGGTAVTDRGICWSTEHLPTIADFICSSGKGKGKFTVYLGHLNSETKYFLRAYATNNIGTAYGDEVQAVTGKTVTDIDGNIYNTVAIGTQVWMVEDLKTIHYRNGDPIPFGNFSSSDNGTTGAYADDDYIGMGFPNQGYFYNWYAVNDTRKLSPYGWHIPTKSDMETLIDFVGGEGNGFKLSDVDSSCYILSPGEDTIYNMATNETGFTAIHAGFLEDLAISRFTTNYPYWSSDNLNETESWFLNLYLEGKISRVGVESINKYTGMSVKCIMD